MIQTVNPPDVMAIDATSTDFPSNSNADAHTSNGQEGLKKRKIMAKRSVVWLHFTSYTDKNGNKRSKCNYCKANLAADSNKNGTSSMKTHLASCKENPASKKNQSLLRHCYVTDSVSGEDVVQLGTWKFDPVAVKRALAEMIILDEAAFSLVEKIGFRRFCQVALPPNFKIPSRRAITRACYDIYVDGRLQLKKYFKESGQRISITTDTWTSLQKISYMSLTAHFIDENWKLQKKILSFCPVDSHRGEELGDLLEKCLKDWGIDKVYSITVDNASSNEGVVRVLKSALVKWGTSILGGQDLHMRCAAHIINLVVGEGIREKDMHKSVIAVRAAVKYIRQSPSRLKKFKEAVELEEIESRKWLCLDVATRWNSLYVMLAVAEKYEMAFERYASRFDRDMRTELNSGINAPGFSSCIDWENVRRLIKFLEHFFYLTEKVSGTFYVTSNLLFPEISEVDSLLQDWEKDVDVHEMATRMRTKYLKYWGDPQQMNKNIFYAMVLDPRHKLDFLGFLLVNMYDEEEGRQYLDMVNAGLRKLFGEYRRITGQSSVQQLNNGVSSGSSETEPRQGLRTHLKAAYKKYKSANGTGSEKTELDKYLGEDPEEDSDNFDVLQWWKLNAPRFPVLAAMARDVLVVPISTVASEAAFSTGGRVLDAFRSSLTPRMAQALICGQDWLRAKERAVSDIEDLDLLDDLEKEFDKLHLDSTILE